MPQLPEWATAYAQECRVLFGLDRWQITVCGVVAPGDDLDNKGMAIVNTRYLSARIEIMHTLEPDEMRHTIMHELLHVAFAPMAQAHFRIEEVIPKKLRRHAEALYNDGLEQTIEGLTRALQQQIKPSEQPQAE